MSNDRKDRAARAEKMRKEREKADKRQRNVISLAIVVVVIALIALGAWAIKSTSSDNAISTKYVAPKHVSKDYSVVYDTKTFTGKEAKNPVTVEAYEDFQCPGCRAFEAQDGPFLKKSLEDGDITLEYHPIAFLDQMSSTEYSSRALNAAMCVLDAKGVKAYSKMHDTLYENQPEENSAGLPDSELIKFAKQSGADGLSSCIKSRKFGPWVEKATAAASKAKISGTPTIKIDGKEVNGPEQNGQSTTPRVPDLKKAIDAAKK